MVFLIQTDLPGWQMASAMSHAIHKIVSKRRCQSYFISRRSPHHGISKDSDLCASAHRCPHYAYARLIARVNSQFIIKPRCIHTGAVCLLFQFPDVSVVLCDGSVGGEEACLGDVHQHHLLPLLLILVISKCLILYLDVVL